MQVLRSCLGLLGTLALAGLPAPTAAQPVGSEFQINTYTTSDQRTGPFGDHVVAADASGNFVVVWSSYVRDRSYRGIFGQRYDGTGEPLGAEFQVHSSAAKTPSVAADADGDFVVVWSSQDGSKTGIFGQRFDSAGSKLGGKFRVNSHPIQGRAAVVRGRRWGLRGRVGEGRDRRQARTRRSGSNSTAMTTASTRS